MSASERDPHEDVTMCVHVGSQRRWALITRQQWKAVLEHYGMLRTFGVPKLDAHTACTILVTGLEK